jgi:hypothetical protein
MSTTNNTICKSHVVPKTVSTANVRRNSRRNQGNADMKSFNGVKPISNVEGMMPHRSGDRPGEIFHSEVIQERVEHGVSKKLS